MIAWYWLIPAFGAGGLAGAMILAVWIAISPPVSNP